jgi:hypothetical protein
MSSSAWGVQMTRDTGSVVRRRRFGILARFEPRQPSVSFVRCHMPASRLILCPGSERIAAELLALLLTLHILLDRLAHQPMSRTLARLGEPSQPSGLHHTA